MRTLTREAAAEVTRKINADAMPTGPLYEAWRYKAWLALGYASWAEYCSAEIASKMPSGRGSPKGTPQVAHRTQVATSLRDQGMPVAAIAAAYHVHPTSIRFDGGDGRRGSAKRQRNGRVVDGPARREPRRAPDIEKVSDASVPRRMNRKPLAELMRKPMIDLRRSTSRIGRLMTEQTEAVRVNRETLGNLYLTELRIAAEAIDNAIAALEK